MPTLEHNGLIEIFRENPSLATHLLALLFKIDVPTHTTVRIADSSLDQLIPVEFRADLVLEACDDKGAVVLSIVFESQREKKPRKKYSWPVYATVARAERECPTVVMVLAIDPDVAAWAAEKIDIGLGFGILQPIVLGPATLPVVTDPAVADKETELAILSAMVHGNGPEGLAVLQAAFGALVRLDEEHAAVYFQIIWDVLREPMRQALEAMAMEWRSEGKATFPPFAQKLIDRGKLEGFRDGKLEGLRDGELKGFREALLRLIARAGLSLTDEERARIHACEDTETLDRWLENVLGAKTNDDVFS